jgi:hypothetical protein
MYPGSSLVQSSTALWVKLIKEQQMEIELAIENSQSPCVYPIQRASSYFKRGFGAMGQ